MSSESTILELVGLIYDAAGSPARWPVFLERLGQILDTTVNLYVQDFSNWEGGATSAVGLDSEFARSYREYYAPKNIYMIRGKQLLRPGEVHWSQELCPDGQVVRSEFYNEWIVPQKLGHGIIGTLFKEQSLVGTIGLIRRGDAKLFSKDDALLVKTLIPHLQRAVQLHQRLTKLQSERNAVTDALNRWPLGVILLNAKSEVLLMNRSAEAILNQNDGLILDRLGLRTSRSNETMTLRGLMHGAMQATLGRNGHEPGGAISLPRPSGKRALSLLVTPACTHPLLFPVNGAAAVVFVSDPDAEIEPPRDLLQRCYGLTQAESVVTVLLIQGKSIAEAAEELCMTKNAVRFHLKHIFGKTGTRRQGELIRLLLTGPAQVRLP